MADKQPRRNKKNFRPTEKGAGMTRAGVKKYRAMNPGSKLKTAVTGNCLLYTSPSPRDATLSRMPSSA